MSAGERGETVVDGLLIRSVPLGGSALSQAAQRGALAAWYARCPEGADAWRARLEEVRDAHPAGWLETLAPAFAATGAAADRLARSAAAGVVITTGQQPGLFGGPAYTFSKALSALALADELEAATGVPVAPVFWAATDDADWLEAAVTYVATNRGLLQASLEGPPTDGVAMADVPLGPLDRAWSALRTACGSAAHQNVLALLESAYVPHATIGTAYVQCLRAMLEPLGIAVIDASHPTLREAADPVLRDALRHAAAIHEALETRGAAIRAAGFSPQVEVVGGLSLVFQTRLESGPDGVRRRRERVPLDGAVMAAREASPGALGPNVLLRPVVERRLLPTAAYVAGPGEYAYFAQVGPVADAMHTTVPLAVPRWACELIEEKVIDRQQSLALSDDDLRDPHAAEGVIARAALEESVADRLERLRITVDTQVQALQESLASEDAPVASETVQGLARDLTHVLDRFDRRLLAGVKRREQEAMREVASLRAAIRPLGQSPERVLNLMPLLARYGPSILSAMVDAARTHARTLVHGAAVVDPAGTSGAS